jgi:hypothetical protein
MTTSTWGVALDGAQARILRDLDRDMPAQALPEELTLDLRPQGTSPAPEACSDDAGDGGAFCQEVLWLLGSHLRRGDFDRLIVAAAPQVLADLRARRNRALDAATVAETAADLLHLSPQGLRDRLRDILSAPAR